MRDQCFKRQRRRPGEFRIWEQKAAPVTEKQAEGPMGRLRCQEAGSGVQAKRQRGRKMGLVVERMTV